MNNKGLTLIEMLAVLSVLAIIAIIITPNIYSSIKNSRKELFDEQLNNIEQGCKNWAADNPSSLPQDNSYSLSVGIKELQDGGYVDDKLENPKNGGYLDDSSVFVLITGGKIEDLNSISSNYKYTYGVFEDYDDYLKDMAIEYVKDTTNISTPKITIAELKKQGYIVDIMKDTTGNIITKYTNYINSKISVDVSVTLNKEKTENEYEAVIN